MYRRPNDTVVEKNLWEIGIRGKMWRMMKKMTECARSAVVVAC